MFRGVPITEHLEQREGWSRAQRKHVKANDICVVCGCSGGLSVHHIIPYRTTKDNSASNLLTLCHRHHVALQRVSDKLVLAPVPVQEAFKHKLQVILEERWLIFKGRELMEQECN